MMKITPIRGSAAAVLLFTATLLGCQGVGSRDGDATDSSLAGSPAGSEVPHQIELWPAISSPVVRSPEYDAQVEAKVASILAEMTLEQKVGQVLQPEIQSITPQQVKTYHIGSVLNGGGSMPRRVDKAAPAIWVSLADEFYNASMDDSDGGIAIPIIWGTDAVHGHGNVTGATLFPHNIGLGAMHNPALIEEIGAATALEVRATGIEWVFGPTLAVAQNDFWGRTYESYSEDPTLVAEYALAMVNGMQGRVTDADFLANDKVVATAKHFLADGGTVGGDDQGDARISEEELVSIHNAGYVPAIEAGVQTLMASFSSWNGVKMHGNEYLLTTALKERMGFDGFVVGDWNGHGHIPGCTNKSCPQALNAGLDMYMVTYDWEEMYHNLIAQVKSGEVDMARLDDAVSRILRVKVRAHLWDSKPSQRVDTRKLNEILGSASNRDVARRAVRESLVLLKNHANLLPLNPKQTILVAGDGADNIGKQAGGWSVSWQGTGNTNAAFPGGTSIYQGIRDAVNSMGGTTVLSVSGDYKTEPDVAVVVVGEEPYAEGQGDRSSLEFEPGDKSALALIRKFQAEGIPVVTVFLSGRPMWVNPEINASDAFVAAWLPGSEGQGVADVLIADVSGTPRYDFTGRLSFSWPKLPTQGLLNPHHANYDPLFALGYGLNYADAGEGPVDLEEDVEGVDQGTTGDLDFYVGRTQEPWTIFIQTPKSKQVLSGPFADLGNFKVNTSDMLVQEDALTLTWKDTQAAVLSAEGGSPIDLTAHLGSEGVLAFNLKVDAMSEGKLTLVIECGNNCRREVDITPRAKSMENKGWHYYSTPLACFAQPGDDFSQVTKPFSLIAEGSGSASIANIQFLRSGMQSVPCELLQ